MTAGTDPLENLIEQAQETDPDGNRFDMEAAVLSTVYREGMAAPDLWTAFHAASWEKPFHAELAAVLKIHGMQPRADLLVIADALEADGTTFRDEELAGIMDGSKAVSVEAAHYCLKRMETQDRKRSLETVLNAALSRVGTDTPDAVIADLQKTIFDPAHGKKLIREYPNEAEAAAGLLERLAARRVDGREYLGLDCGIKHLNEVLNGLTEGLFVLAGAPSTGKTTLAKQIADHVAEVEKTPVLFWSFEQSPEELQIKSLARLASVDSRAIWKGRTDDPAWDKAKTAAEKYERGPGEYLTIIEAGREDTLDRIRAVAQAAKYKAKGKTVLLVLDYLQIIPSGPNAPDNKREQVDANLSELRRLARDLKSPVLVLSSLNRESYKKDGKLNLASLKESGGIEYSADGVICLERVADRENKDLFPNRNQETIRVEAHVLKNRNGELAKVMLDFTPAWALFEDVDRKSLSWSDALDGSK